jgi:hypothetical protein
VANQLVGGCGAAGPQDDRGMYGFTPLGVRPSYHRGLQHGVVPGQRALDFPRVDVESPGDDHVVQPVDDRYKPVVVGEAQITGVHPSISIKPLGVCNRRVIRQLPITAHRVAAANPKLTDLPGRDVLTASVHDPHGADSRRTATRLESPHPRRLYFTRLPEVVLAAQGTYRPRGFRQPVNLHEYWPQELESSLQPIHGHRCAAIDDRS